MTNVQAEPTTEVQTDDHHPQDLLEAAGGFTVGGTGERFALLIEWARPVAHPRDSIQELHVKLRSKLRSTIPGGTSGRIDIEALETDQDRTVIVLSTDGDGFPSPEAVLGVNRAIRRYNKEDNRTRDPLRSSLAKLARSGEEKPRSHPKATRGVDEDEWERAQEVAAEWESMPDSAPQLHHEDVKILTLPAAPVSITTSRDAGGNLR
ncbi:hypothetical protein [Halovivax cerinus]|uniref:Uncharacterized protein n=1 Tax=Halovivax cerinus TaxID=1487865 RepID=A0ABD5NKC1_9EURY|nr:hypothetical protein [Halovivax cerinus]